ncbi:lytic transglycosylase domain-containing protein [Candidatus Epulonipiscium viviparus]|uniref:lytic transglycosylase domain-containing protein n=1 Tax=Candidatus Epulonipiscium viviparus TaxID=420336 RepID=UPI00016BFC64|nr:lytic transglycosylase domain-containing protein [Candidatus Epulopiscium viviparus]
MNTKIRIYILLLVLILGLSGIYIAYKIYPRPYLSYVEELSELYGLDELFIYAIIQTETHFDPNAVSRSGARGLMQIMEPTGLWAATELKIENYTADDLFDPYINMQIGTWYISRLIRNYDNNIDLALAAYNGGSGNVAKWLNNTQYSHDGQTLHTIPFKETHNYVIKVNFHYFVYRVLYFF